MDSRRYESIKYTFTEPELRELGSALARETQTVNGLQEEKASASAAFAAQIKAAEKRVDDFATKINNGYELREVECMVLLETPRPGMKRIIRADTSELVRDEPMTISEMQGSFGFSDAPGEGEQP